MTEIYENGSYLASNPSWHEEDSPWKAMQIIKMLRRNSLTPESVCEIGCGAGEILNQLSMHFQNANFVGYEISPQAFQICEKKTKENLSFKLANLLEEDQKYDLLIACDVLEHIEDYFNFLRKLKTKASHKIFHIPLDLSVQTVLRVSPILRCRKNVGHIHYFTKETALESLKDTGHEIVDYFYTATSLETSNLSWKQRLFHIPRKIAFAINHDWAVRILGGYSLLVLTK